MADKLPQWQRELINFKGIKSLFVLEKNINDLYLSWDVSLEKVEPLDYDFLPMTDVLAGIFEDETHASGYRMVFWDPISHFTNPRGDQGLVELLKEANREAQELAKEEARINAFAQRAGQESQLVRDSRIIRALLTRNVNTGVAARPLCVVVGMASRIVPSAESLMPEDINVFSNLLLAADGALTPDTRSKNTLVLLADNLRDLPEWLISSNPNLRSIVVAKPDRDAREAYVEAFFGIEKSAGDTGQKSERERFIDKTDGMTLRELDELRRMYRRPDAGMSLSALVDVYKYGMRE
ncbi:MAG: hypothetical protein Q4B54_10850, partial [Coriobacteriales bacterium]|nr:hypothetical protein [Coriobacteriales bacterium]